MYLNPSFVKIHSTQIFHFSPCDQFEFSPGNRWKMIHSFKIMCPAPPWVFWIFYPDVWSLIRAVVSPQSLFPSTLLTYQTTGSLQRPAWCLKSSLRPEASSAESTSATLKDKSGALCSIKVHMFSDALSHRIWSGCKQEIKLYDV